MILNHKELLEKYKSDVVIKNLITEEKLFKIDKSLYSTEKQYSNLEFILKKYNNFIFTMETALYLYGFKGIKLNNYSIATKRKAKVIKNELIKQYFIPDDLYEIGLTRINYIGYEVKLYDKERLLLEIIKNKDKMDNDLYENIMREYRNNITNISISKIYDYIKYYKKSNTILNEFEKEFIRDNKYKEVKMKGIVLAGGSGTRLYPITEGVSKQLLPIYDKPMIFYPISVLMLAGIKDILIITTAQDQPAFKNLLKDGSQFGVNFEYIIQPSPDGLAQAFILGEKFVGDNPSALILGDNLFYGNGFVKMLENAVKNADLGYATNFGIEVPDPERFGIMEVENKDGEVYIKSVEEKPEHPKSNYAITGLYFYPKGVCEKAKNVKPSKRGELEITSINDMYLQEGKLKGELLGGGFNWFDTGTFDSLYDAISAIKASEQNRGKIIACLEQIAYNNGWITLEQLSERANLLRKNSYGEFLENLVKSEEMKRVLKK